jgi:hypothetical protein
MAKATVITPALLINTGRAPAGNNGANANGQVVRVDLFFDANTPDINISLTAVMQQGCFNTVQCIYVDNSLNPATVILTVPGIQQRIVVNGFSQSLEPLYVSDSAIASSVLAHSITSNIPGFPVSIWFSNVPQPFYQKTGLINSVKNILVTLPIGNTIGHAYSFILDTTSSMKAFNVADWSSIFIDNSAGFQHLYVNDISAGATVAVINPYTIAQFSTLGVGSNQYSFTAFDLAVDASQANFSYEYNVPLLMRAQKSDTYFNQVADTGQYTVVSSYVLGAGGQFQVYPNFVRKRVSFSGATAFTVQFNGVRLASALDAAGVHTFTLDRTDYSAIFSSTVVGIITVLTVAAQTIQMRDKF